MRLSLRTKLIKATGVPVLALALLLSAVVSAAPAQASGWSYPQVYWTVQSSNLHAWGHAYAHDYGCGIKDCATGSNLYIQAGRLSGAYGSNLVRASSSIAFDGVGIDVGVAIPLGVSAGFSDLGSSCSHGWWDGNSTWVSVDFGTGVICDVNTLGWVAGMTTTVTGGVRFGAAWTVRSGSNRVQLGGF